ncbi:MAG TPA: choice-of-anchor Q domain-containing protein, partial [Stellaceae bacterium]|nr:choice-of-anchor Q domain-containing protein [Stellaceae bacterium]
RSGSASAGFITVEPAAGAAPVVDGTGLGIPNGQNGLFTISSASYVRIKGFEIRNYVSGNTNVPCGIYVEGAGSHIEILGNHIHNITTTLKTTAGDALGIAIYGTEAPAAITWLTIDGNELDDLTTGYSESLSLSGNVTRWQVTDNLIHDNDNIGINIEGFYQTAPDPTYDQARNGLVAGNTVYNITSKNNPSYGGSLGADGIYLSGAASVTVAQNLVYQTDYGIELASEIHGRATSNSLVHDNVIHHSYLSGITIGGADQTQNGGTTGCTIANNTLFENDTTQSGSGEIQIQYNASANSFLNNIAYANAQGLLVNFFSTSATRPANFDNNLYYSPAGNAGSQWIWRNVTYNGFAAYQAGAGNDAHGRFADPQFLSLTTPNLNVAGTSPAINHGRNLGLLRQGKVDFAGNPRTVGTTVDIGAYEH